MSIPSIIETLSAIEEVAHIYPKAAHAKAHVTLTQMNDIQKRLFDDLSLASFATVA